MREDDAGTQNTVLMQVMRQRVKDRAAVMRTRANQRDFTAKIDALLNDTFAVTIRRQVCGFVLA
ncbi:hypothetical protein D3C85_1759940 [compost metagenome]